MKEKSQLLTELQASRMAVARDARSLADELNFRRKIEDTVRQRPLAWLGGAALAGFTFSIWRRRPVQKSVRSAKKEAIPEPKAGFTFWAFLLATIKILLPAVRPLLTAYATKRMADLAGKLGRR